MTERVDGHAGRRSLHQPVLCWDRGGAECEPAAGAARRSGGPGSGAADPPQGQRRGRLDADLRRLVLQRTRRRGARGSQDMDGGGGAVAMLGTNPGGPPFGPEIRVDRYEAAPPARPVADVRRAKIAVVTTGAIVPRGNPDHLKRSSETRWVKYTLAGRDRLTGDEFEGVHGGFFNLMASGNPNLVLPLDVLRDLQREGKVADLLDTSFTTTGNDQRVADCRRNGAEIAAALQSAGVNGVLLVAT